MQLDYQLPERFDLSYIDEAGEKERPVVIHRAILGSLDRFIAFLLEETKGVLPMWLAPVMVNIIPVNLEYHMEYAKQISDLLTSNYRVNLDNRNEKLSYRMRESVIKKIPVTIILGQKEVDDNRISYRLYGSVETHTISVKEFLSYLQERIDKRN